MNVYFFRTSANTREQGKSGMTFKRLFTAMISATSVAAALSAAPLAVSPATAADNGNIIEVGRNATGTERVALGLNKSIVLDLPVDAHDILVANPEVADAVTRTARRI
ncbi:MAG: pilus assembly protein N-terminal domain-containing protein, partial [Oricola sp.]